MLLWWVLIKCQCCRLRRKGTRGRSSRGGSRCSCGSRCLFSSGLSMHFGMTLFFIGPCKFTSTDFARKWLLSSVSPYVSGEVVGPTKGPHANSALEWLLPSVDSDVSCKFVWAWKPPIAVRHRASIRPLVDWSFARTIGVLPRAHRH